MALTIASTTGGNTAGLAELAGRWGRRFLYGALLPATAIVVVAAGWYVYSGETPLALVHRLTTPPSVAMALPPRPGSEAKRQPGDALLTPPATTPEAPPPKPGGGAIPGASPMVAPAELPDAPPPKPAKGVLPGPSPMKPTPLNKVAELPPAPPPAPASGALPVAPAAPVQAAASAPMSASAANAALSPMTPTAPAAPAAAATPSAAPSATVAPPAEASATAAPSAPPAMAANAPPPPPVTAPQVPPGGEPLAPPSFAQLPARTDLKALPPAPAADLLRDSPDGPLPVVAEGREPRMVYARPVAADKDKKVRVAIAVVGLGLSRDAAEAAIAKLPPEIDLSFSPDAGNLDGWIKKAREAGHEVLIDLPLEPPNYPLHDPGPLAILSRDGPGAAVDRLHQVLGKGTGYVGVAASLRSPVTAGGGWPAILKDLKSRGLLLAGDGAVPAASAADAPALAPIALVPDQTPFRAAIDVQLDRLLATAQRDGSAVGYVSPLPVTFERLLAWSATLAQKDAVLVPLSAVAKPQS